MEGYGDKKLFGNNHLKGFCACVVCHRQDAMHVISALMMSSFEVIYLLSQFYSPRRRKKNSDRKERH